MNKKIILILSLLIIGILGRIIPHPPNVTAMIAIALLSSHAFKNKWIALLNPLAGWWISDLIINNLFLNTYFETFTWLYPGFLWQYSSFCIIILIGYFSLKKLSLKKVFLSTITSSLLFFIITNFGVWISGSLYPLNISGLITCYILAIPFFKGTLLGFLFYSSFLFGAFELFKSKLLLNNQF